MYVYVIPSPMFKKGDSKERVFRKIRDVLERDGVEYKKDEINTTIAITSIGENTPFTMMIVVSEGTIEFRCKLAFEATEENYNSIVHAINDMNSRIVMGAFIVDPEEGWVMYRYSYIYIDVKPDLNLLRSLIMMVVNTVDSHDEALGTLMPTHNEDRYTMMFV